MRKDDRLKQFLITGLTGYYPISLRRKRPPPRTLPESNL
jgi:hypothetical protein